MADRALSSRWRGCRDCGGLGCDGVRCHGEIDAYYERRPAPPTGTVDECSLCGCLLRPGGVCRCELTVTGAPAFPSYEEDGW